MTEYPKKLIEVAIPLGSINTASVREGYIYRRHPTVLHKWWAQRPLAACRGILLAQLIDDPSSQPERFPSDEDVSARRAELFELIERAVQWESTADDPALGELRLEIAGAEARRRIREARGDDRDAEILSSPKPDSVRQYIRERLPALWDPFGGGGSIPFEAQRLSLNVVATDLNPVAVLINQALIGAPARFAGARSITDAASSALGRPPLAQDVEFYAKELVAELEPTRARLYGIASEDGFDVVGWIWARTVPSPDPAFGGQHVPLLSTYWLNSKRGAEAWLEVQKDRDGWDFQVQVGPPADRKAIAAGTKLGRGSFRCVLSGATISAAYIREQGTTGNVGQRMMAVVLTNGRERRFRKPSTADVSAAYVEPDRDFVPQTALPESALGFRVQKYGITEHQQLFLPRQLAMLAALTRHVRGSHERILADARAHGDFPEDDVTSLQAGGKGPRAYADAVVLYLALAVSKLVDYHCSLVGWYHQEARTSHLFTKQAVPMVWDFVENNPFASVGGSVLRNFELVVDYLDSTGWQAKAAPGAVMQRSATEGPDQRPLIISTDPPYYDNVPYADLSDLFYVWLRLMLRDAFPELTRTMLVPKSDELIVEPARHESTADATEFFEHGMRGALQKFVDASDPAVPATIYYAFKQSETSSDGTGSTGWESFLQSIVDSGLTITATWPVRTERGARSRGIGANALASSLVLACRHRDSQERITRSDFRRLLHAELPAALSTLRRGNIAPVDLAQASIGPGMAVFSRYGEVLEADGTRMTVRSALHLIHRVTDELAGEVEGELDRDTRFAVTWYETHGFQPGDYGDAETLAKARGVSVSGVEDSGILRASAGKVRLLGRVDLPEDWDPNADERLTVWEATQHLIKRLEDHGEAAAARLLRDLGPVADDARDLAYRLYTTCERKSWAEEARAYNSLVGAWPELEKLASQYEGSVSGPQTGLFE